MASVQASGQTNHRPTYAQSMEKSMQKQEEDAIIIPAVPGVPDFSYASAVAKIVGPENVFFVSRISNGRVIIFLKDGDMARNFVSNHPTINIDTHHLSTRLYVNPALKLRIAHAYPFISNYEITQKLADVVELVSPIQYQKSGFKEKDLSHICNLVRYVYIKEKEGIPIPDALTIWHNNRDYKLFLSIENNQLCFLCNRRGHTQLSCPNHQSQQHRLQQVQLPTNTISDQNDETALPVPKPNKTAGDTPSIIHKDTVQITQDAQPKTSDITPMSESSDDSASDSENPLLKTPNNKLPKRKLSALSVEKTSPESPARKFKKLALDSDELQTTIVDISTKMNCPLEEKDAMLLTELIRSSKCNESDLRTFNMKLNFVFDILQEVLNLKISKSLKYRVKNISQVMQQMDLEYDTDASKSSEQSLK